MKVLLSVNIFIFFFSPLYSQLWKNYSDSAKTFTDKKNIDKAIEFYRKSLEELKIDSAGTTSYAQICDSLGNLCFRKQLLRDAKKYYLVAREIKEKTWGKQNASYASTCYNLGTLCLRMGQFDSAEAFSIEAKQIREKVEGKENTDYASSCNRLASVYFYKSQYDKSEPLYIEAMKVQAQVQGRENPDFAGFCNNLATLYMVTGKYESAEPLLLEAKQIREKKPGRETADYAQACGNLGLLFFYMNQNDKSESLLIEAKQITEKVLGEYNRENATSCDNLALLYQTIGQYDKAEPLYIEAKQIWEKILGKENSYYAKTNSNLGVLYLKIGQFEKAERVLLESRQILEKVSGKENGGYATVCYDLGQVYKNMGLYDSTKSLYIQAKEIRQKELGNQHPEYGASCYELGVLYWLMHQPLLAEQEFNESSAVNRFNLKAVFSFTNEKEKETYLKNISQEDDKAYSFYLSEKLRSEQPYTLSLFRRNLILASSRALNKQLFYGHDSAVISKYNEWSSLKRQLSILYSKPLKERREDPAKLEDSAGRVEKELFRISASFKKEHAIINWKDIQGKLRPNEASIEFAQFHLYDGKRYTDTILYVALVVRRDAALPVMVKLFNENKLSQMFASAGNTTNSDGIKALYTLKKAGDRNASVSNKSIYDLVWKPLEKQLKGIKTIYFAPAGLLHRISFAALPVSSVEVLSDKYHLVQLGTTASVTDLKPTFISSPDILKLYGGLKYEATPSELKLAVRQYEGISKREKIKSEPDSSYRGDQIKYLPGTKAEIEGINKLAISAHCRVSLLSGINGTEESFKALDGKASPSVIHIATHGFFFPDTKIKTGNGFQRNTKIEQSTWWQSDNPMLRSGLLFAGANIAWQGKPINGIDDGILTAYEVSGMYLPHTKFVVLSACETALGDIQGSEGVYGLQRAFEMAGVPNLVMSLWKVPDLATAEFMQDMYKKIFAGKSVADAFNSAQAAMRDKYREDPYKWAAWVLIR